MNPFIDYKKRDVELPAGCKDLLDVLQRARGAVEQAPECSPGGLADIKPHVIRLLASATRLRMLSIGSGPNSVLLMWGKSGLMALVHVDTRREKAVREVFANAGVSLIHEHCLEPNGPRSLWYPIPHAASRAAQLIRDLLTSGLGLPGDVVLEFRYRALTPLAQGA